MFTTYLRRELVHRRKHSLIIAIGMALAIALVVVVNAVSAGVSAAQSTALASVYGVGTDITVTQASEPGEGGGGPGGFSFGADEGATAEDGTTTLEQTQLSTARGTTSFDAADLDTVLAVDGVEDATATLSLESTSFSGEIPDLSQTPAEGSTGDMPAPPSGGADGAGGSSFGVDSFSVEGIDLGGAALGPLSAVELADGRTFEGTDSGANVAVLDATYAESAELAVGDVIEVGGAELEIIGTVASTSAEAATASDVYLPLDTAQTLADLDGQVTTVYVQATGSDAVDTVQADLEEALPEATVSTQSDLASSVSGSLGTASDLVASLGTWLSIIVLLAAFLIAILFTISGVTRRTREFGTLKAIGWSNRRIVGQVAGESVVQSLLGGAIGIAVGLVAVLVINLAAPSLSTASTGGDAAAGGASGGAAEGMAGGMGGGPGFGQQATTVAADVTLNAPVTIGILAIAVGLAVIGGVLAGAIGGWRAARLRPAEALRSVA